MIRIFLIALDALTLLAGTNAQPVANLWPRLGAQS
jgi:hypothetical protein